MKIKSLAIIAVSTVLLLAGISVAAANPIAVHTAANTAAAVPPPPRGPQPPQPTRIPPAGKSKQFVLNVGLAKSTTLTPS